MCHLCRPKLLEIMGSFGVPYKLSLKDIGIFVEFTECD